MPDDTPPEQYEALGKSAVDETTELLFDDPWQLPDGGQHTSAKWQASKLSRIEDGVWKGVLRQDDDEQPKVES